MDDNAEAKATQDAAIQKQKDDERLKALEKERADLQTQLRRSWEIPLPMEIAQVAATLAQGKMFKNGESAAPYVESAFALWSASKEEVREYLREQLHDVDQAILLHPDDLNAIFAEADENTVVSEMPVKFDDVLRSVIGKAVRPEDRNKRFRDWLRTEIRARVEKEKKSGELGGAEVEKLVDAQTIRRLEQLKASGFSNEQYVKFLSDYRAWWALRLSRQRTQRAAKAAAKRWAKSRS